jgi:hypothetical protein
MLREDAGAILIEALSDLHAAADQPGYLSNAAYNQCGAQVNMVERGIERF